MQPEKKVEIITMEGTGLLARLGMKKDHLLLDIELYRNVTQYTESALLYQLRQVMAEKEITESCKKMLFFADFSAFFRKKDQERNERFEKLMKDGFRARWPEQETVYTYVPFEKSQSKAKACVISFIREDLFEAVRARLDLDIRFGDYPLENLPEDSFALQGRIPPLSKLYAYRGLYLTEATRLDGSEIRSLLDPKRIIVLKDMNFDFPCQDGIQNPNAEIVNAWNMEIFGKPSGQYPPNKPVNLDAVPDLAGSAAHKESGIKEKDIEIGSLFDGVGMLSPRAADIFNRALRQDNNPDPTTKDAVSFQFRLPFCKGMLHKVDFHGFLKNEVIKKQLKRNIAWDTLTEAEKLEAEMQIETRSQEILEQTTIQDAFGVERNIADADIILNTSLFKLYGLLKNEITCNQNAPDAEKIEAANKAAMLMDYYFRKVNAYGHTVYIAKTDLQQRNSGYTNLTYQILNTLKMDSDVFNRLVDQHLARAENFNVAKILSEKGFATPPGSEDKENVQKYLRVNYLLALDHHISDLIESCRMQRINALYEGKLEVEGDMRFLCRDLLYWLCLIARNCKFQNQDLDATIIRNYIRRGEVYLPGISKQKIHQEENQTCALFRSPHLCANENVLATVAAQDGLHGKYLSHLKRVVFVGAYSHMPGTLGGADFDGDIVVVAFQKEVVDACRKSCYREDGGESLPLICIPTLSTSTQRQNTPAGYTDIDTINNTFNSSIGIISNATMKICAAEKVAEDAGKLPELWNYSSRYCAILNGVEIDAAKNGLRPDLKSVQQFVSSPHANLPAPAIEIADEISIAMQQVGDFLAVKEDLDAADQNKIVVVKTWNQEKQHYEYAVKYRIREDDSEDETSGKKKHEHRIATIDAHDVTNKPLIYQLLCRWAEARETHEDKNGKPKPSEQQKLAEQAKINAIKQLNTLFHTKETKNYPRSEILRSAVFRYPDEKSADIPVAKDIIREVLESYQSVSKKVSAAKQESTQDIRNNLRRRMIYLLQYKYDDIDCTLEAENTIRQMADMLIEQLPLSVKTTENFTQHLKKRFYDPVCLEAWLNMSLAERKAWLKETLEITDGSEMQLAVFTDFNFRGYNLLYFALREAMLRTKAAESREAMNTVSEDAFCQTLLTEAGKGLKGGNTVAQIKSRLAPICRAELKCRLEAALGREITTQDMIRLIYATPSEHDIVWRLFTWKEIKNTMEVNTGVR